MVSLSSLVVFVSGMCLGLFLAAQGHAFVSRRLQSERER